VKIRSFLVIVLALIAAGGLIFGYREMSKERKLETEREKPVAAKSLATLGTNGEAKLTLDEETQRRIALKVQQVASSTMVPELQGFGRVLDPAPLAALVAEIAVAHALLAASQKEFDRLKLLNQQKNASDKALQVAEVAARRDQIALESVRTRLLSSWGQAIAGQPDLAAFVRSLASLESALVRIDLPAGEVLTSPPFSARIQVVSAGKTSLSARLLGPAMSVDPQMQGQGFLFLLRTNSPQLVPGMAVAGYLPLRQEPLHGFTIPDSAVVRIGGHGWVYLQTGKETFTRRMISLEHPREDGWFVTDRLAAEDHVVIEGAQVLLSEEQKYQIKLFE
jgi:hypothetical protein